MNFTTGNQAVKINYDPSSSVVISTQQEQATDFENELERNQKAKHTSHEIEQNGSQKIVALAEKMVRTKKKHVRALDFDGAFKSSGVGELEDKPAKTVIAERSKCRSTTKEKTVHEIDSNASEDHRTKNDPSTNSADMRKLEEEVAQNLINMIDIIDMQQRMKHSQSQNEISIDSNPNTSSPAVKEMSIDANSFPVANNVLATNDANNINPLKLTVSSLFNTPSKGCMKFLPQTPFSNYVPDLSTT